jgi:hypothetical protein
MNAKMFSILTDKLYTNKVAAVIRELSANAVDSHNQAGKGDVPFVLTIPTWIDAIFKIRDYGTGIDPDKFYDIYTNLGYSTKDSDNEFIGTYGLGSKTPFAIADTYSILNYYNGTAYSYTAYKDEGMPTVSLIGSQPTKEPNGLQISVNSERTSLYQFKEELRKQLKYFPVKPIITNDDDFEWEEMPDLSKGYAFDTYGSSLEIIMGQICYYVDTYDLPYDSEIRNTVGYGSMSITAELGDVDITPSRESLELSTKTLEWLQTKTAQILETLTQDVKDDIAAATTDFEKFLVLEKAPDKVSDVPLTINHRSMSVKEWYGHYRAKPVLSCDKVIIHNHLKSRRSSKTVIKFEDMSNKLTNWRYALSKHKQKSITYLNDLTWRIGHTIKDNAGKDLTFQNSDRIFLPRVSKKADFEPKVKEAKAELDELGVTYTLLSSVVTESKAATRSVNSAVRLKSNVLVYNENSKSFKVVDDKTIPSVGYYVKLSNYEPVGVDHELIRFAAHNHTIFGFRKSYWKDAEKEGLTELSSVQDTFYRKAKSDLIKSERQKKMIEKMYKLSCVGRTEAIVLEKAIDKAENPIDYDIKTVVKKFTDANRKETLLNHRRARSISYLNSLELEGADTIQSNTTIRISKETIKSSLKVKEYCRILNALSDRSYYGDTVKLIPALEQLTLLLKGK